MLNERKLRRSCSVAGAVAMLVGCGGGGAADGTSETTESVNGATMSAIDYPYAARVDYAGGGGVYSCSGTVIAPRVILTAAHCANDNAAVEASYAPGGRQTRRSTRVVKAPDGSDVALYLLTADQAFKLVAYPKRALRVPSSFGARLVGRRAHGALTNDKLLVVSELLQAWSEGRTTPYVFADLSTGYVAAEHGDSGGALYFDGTREIAAVVHGGPDYTKGYDTFARIDRVGTLQVQIVAPA